MVPAAPDTLLLPRVPALVGGPPAALATVSIVIPAYNEASGIGALLAYLRRAPADESGLEVIVADGGSTDDTRALAQRRALARRRGRVGSTDDTRALARQGGRGRGAQPPNAGPPSSTTGLARPPAPFSLSCTPTPAPRRTPWPLRRRWARRWWPPAWPVRWGGAAYRGWTEFSIRTAADAAHATWLFKLNYQRLRGRGEDALLAEVQRRATARLGRR